MGVVPNLTAMAVASAVDVAGNFSIATIAEAILFTTKVLRSEPGSVIVLELQTFAFEPIEQYKVCWDNIRIAGARNIVVIEAAGNRGVDLYIYPPLNRSKPGTFKDSFALMVAACTSAYPHTIGASNSEAGSMPTRGARAC